MPAVSVTIRSGPLAGVAEPPRAAAAAAVAAAAADEAGWDGPPPAAGDSGTVGRRAASMSPSWVCAAVVAARARDSSCTGLRKGSPTLSAWRRAWRKRSRPSM